MALRFTLEGEPSVSSFLAASDDPLLPHSLGFDEYFDPPLESKYECPICLLGLREPMQTSCGHRFCEGCILRAIRDAGPKCPVDDEDFSETQLYPDKYAKREMMALAVFCRMKKQHGCPWKGALAELEGHLMECQFAYIDCPRNCGQTIQKKDLEQHLENNCPCETCIYCKALMPLTALENHYQNCPKHPLTCEKCRGIILREKMEKHLDKECPLVEIQCPFSFMGCTFEGLQSDVDKHIDEQLASHVMGMARKVSQLMLSGAETRADRGAPPRSLPGAMGCSSPEQTSQRERELLTTIQAQEKERDQMRHIITSLTCTVRFLEHQVEEARTLQERQIQELTLRFNHLETQLLENEGRVCNGIYLWKIENYAQLCQDGFHDCSPPFYTKQNGYKLCLRMHLHGNFLALFVHMMQGQYDNILKWPFTGRIDLSIMDQSGARNHRSRTFLAGPFDPAFQRPTAPCSYLGYGYTDFAPINLEQIQGGEYVKNSTVMVKFEFHRI